jgi:hypothetical protein
MKSLIAAMLLSTAILRMPADEGAGGVAASDPTRIDKLREAVNKLDDADDAHWNADGTAKMEAVEAIFGDSTPTRAEVDAIGRLREAGFQKSAENDPNPAPPPAPTNIDNPRPPAPNPPATATPGRIVTLTFDPKRDAEGKPTFSFDGEHVAAAVVTRVYDDGSINVKAFAPNGGADQAFTGVRHKADVDAMPDGADKNAAMSVTWDWPARA